MEIQLDSMLANGLLTIHKSLYIMRQIMLEEKTLPKELTIINLQPQDTGQNSKERPLKYLTPA